MLEKYGPRAVIAGGSEGVGASFAHQLADRGFNPVLIARKPGPLESTAADVRQRGVEVRTLALDLLDPASVPLIVAATSDVSVGLLIFNAGANSYGHDFIDGALVGHAGVIGLNITAQLALTHHFGGLMKSRGRGRDHARRLPRRLHGFCTPERVRRREGLQPRVRGRPLARAPRSRRRRARARARRDADSGHGAGRPELRHPGSQRGRARRHRSRGAGPPGRRPGVGCRWERLCRRKAERGGPCEARLGCARGDESTAADFALSCQSST
ncbi:SDR family NAD(P)-dependent oxidoreductase [Nocardioides sp. B-3]|uniref:SDR family NAD(P)-dependent oxidoreductase n=1 Tax=Nocardioides sp. B-3 TaxID=2895565 RepID=UPI00215254AC|nr:SDR family NAD(P)-dependent oxidoreductase [Nocardioides sp. B-3]UUZ59437.1 SDR family NAD(P)-dependent oxidoreductase [Nocardioides sp. B-3]